MNNMKIEKIIPMAEPLLNGNELKYLTDCIKSGWISSVGKYVNKFEEGFAEYIGCKYGVAVHNGTIALHLALAALGIKPGDEVIIPALTFAATANVVLYTGAKPILVDVEKDTWNIDPELIENKISENTKAIIPVHLYGYPCEMDRIMEIAAKYNLFVIEDAAEAHGAEYKGKKVGGIGTINCFSFFGNKIITTGEGGICLCNDTFVAERMSRLRDHGMRKDKRYWHDEVGFNYRMTNLQAAVGVAQLERINFFVEKKREIAQMYNSYLCDIEEIILPIEKEWVKSSFWMFSILLKPDYYYLTRDKLIDFLKEKGIETRPIFYPLYKMPPYKDNNLYPNTENISASGLSLPSAVTLKEEDIKYVCGVLKNILVKKNLSHVRI